MPKILSMSSNVFFLGNALLDVSAPCEIDNLQKFHLESDENVEAKAVHEPLFNYLLTCSTALYTPGGSAQNSSRVAQWIFQKFKGSQAIFVGSVGNDDFGKKLQEFLKKAGVLVHYDIHNVSPTGVTAALVTNDGKRSLCARLGAASVFDENFLDSPEAQFSLQNSAIIYVEGYFISHSSTCVLNLAKFSHNQLKSFAINLSAPYICEMHFEFLKQCLIFADIIIGNRKEVETLISVAGLKCSSAEECALALASFSSKPCIAVVTQGPDPVFVANKHLNTVHSYDVPNISKIGDTIGCGDAFVGGLLAGLALKMLVDNAVRCAIYCASEVAKQRGCCLPDYPAAFESI